MSGTASTKRSQDIRALLWRVLRGLGRRVRNILVGEPQQPVPFGFDEVRAIGAEVVVYFPDSPAKLYQLTQWLPVLEVLDRHHRVTIVTRRKSTYERIGEYTALQRAHAPWFRHLSELYEANDFKVALYVNNSMRNFQSLSQQSMLHVHVNHGESDKICMVSNQVKAYDRVIVAGEAALQRHRAALLTFDESKLVPVGRPQLDHVPEPSLPTGDRRTVLYAPTWEGENEANNYTSVDVYGARIVETVLAMPNVRLVYKPHPRVAGSNDPGVAQGHSRIVDLIESAQHANPEAGHTIAIDGNVLALFAVTDTMITDVSSVALDFLYLNTRCPMFLTDRRSDRELLARESPVSQCSHVIDTTSIADLGRELAEEDSTDSLEGERVSMREFYFGSAETGRSTDRFLTTIDELITERDALTAKQAESGLVRSSGVSDD